MATKQYGSIGDYYGDIQRLTNNQLPSEQSVVAPTIHPLVQRQNFFKGFNNLSGAATDFATRLALALWRKQAKKAVAKQPNLMAPKTGIAKTFGEIMSKKVAGVSE